MGAILMVSLLLLVLPTSALERQEPAAGWLDVGRTARTKTRSLHASTATVFAEDVSQLQKVFLAARSSLQARNSVALDPLFKT